MDGLRQQLEEANERYSHLQAQMKLPHPQLAEAVAAAVQSERAAHAAELAKTESHSHSQVRIPCQHVCME